MATSILDFAFPSMLLWGPDLVQIYNDGYIPFLGASHPWALGIPSRECWPEAIQVMGPIYERVLRGETVSLADQPLTIRTRGPGTASEDVTATFSYTPVRDENGSVGGILCTVVNQRAAEALRHSESTFRLLVDAVQDYGIFMLDRNGLVVSWNHGAERIKGYTADEILGRHFSTFYTDEDRARAHPEDELRIASELGRYEEAGWR
ncbi:MAG: PAS domain-containing protein, partial [Longimicrobiales bacterium]